MLTFIKVRRAGIRARRAGAGPSIVRDGSSVAFAVPVLVALFSAALAGGCGARGGGEAARPGRPCGSSAVGNLLTPRWQQCWFTADGGRWRTLHHDLHYDSLVVHVEAASLDDARAIAQRFIENQPRFKHITVYAYKEPSATPGPVRRVSWEATGGFEFLDYDLADP